MASSSKIVFSLDTLRERALAAIDSKIANVLEQLSLLQDADMFAASVEEWRRTEVERFWALSNRLFPDNHIDPVSDEEFEQFKVAPKPKQDVHLVQRLDRELRGLEAERTKMLAKTSALQGDEAGNVSLTTSQLRDFFGL